MAKTVTRKSMTSAARNSARAVVRIIAHGYSEIQIQSILDPRFVVSEEWIGSGFFIKVDNRAGYLLTNSHVARNAKHLEIQSILTSDERFRVEVVGLVKGLEPDVALLKLPPSEAKRFLVHSELKTFPFLSLGNSQKLLRSEVVRAIGYPLGMNEPNISSGEISNFISGTEEMTERLVTDAPINPGNSGGPAIINSGKVIGLNTSIVVGANNIGFITPAHLVSMAIRSIKLEQHAGICQLAATIQKNSLANSHYLGLEKPEGVIVKKVYRSGLAASAGLRPRDIILKINSFTLDRHGNIHEQKGSRKRNLFDILHQIPIGNPVRFSVFRNKKVIELSSQAIHWPGDGFPSQPILAERKFIFFAGLVIQEVCAEIANALSTVGLDHEIAYQEFLSRKSKLILTHISDDTIADELDLSLGDFIVRAQGQAVKNLKELHAALNRSIVKKSSSFILEFSSGALAHLPMSAIDPTAAEIKKFAQQPN